MNIYQVSEEERVKAAEYCDNAKQYKPAVYNRASLIVEKLGLAGLWRGYDVALAVVIKGILGEE
jgi:hypothetical protein